VKALYAYLQRAGIAHRLDPGTAIRYLTYFLGLPKVFAIHEKHFQ
jgi:hypothetical protein